MKRLTDTVCIQKYSINPSLYICAGETGGNKDTCQVDKLYEFLKASCDN